MGPPLTTCVWGSYISFYEVYACPHTQEITDKKKGKAKVISACFEIHVLAHSLAQQLGRNRTGVHLMMSGRENEKNVFFFFLFCLFFNLESALFMSADFSEDDDEKPVVGCTSVTAAGYSCRMTA